MKVGEVLGGMHEDPNGTTVVVNGAELLCAEAHQYSGLLADNLNALMASRPQGGVSLVLAGRDLEVSKLLLTGLDRAHHIQLSRHGQAASAEFLPGTSQDDIPAGLARFEGPLGSPPVVFSPLRSDAEAIGDELLELPIGTEGAIFSTVWSQNLLVHGGTLRERQNLVASMARSAREAGLDAWVATAGADSPASADWRQHRDGMATGVVQTREMLRHISHELFPRIDACRALGVDNYQSPRLPSHLRRPVLLFIDDFEGLTLRAEEEEPALYSSRQATRTLIGFLAQTARLTGLTMVIGSKSTGTVQQSEYADLHSQAARLLLGPASSEMRKKTFGSDVPLNEPAARVALYRATPGIPAVALQRLQEISSSSRQAASTGIPF